MRKKIKLTSVNFVDGPKSVVISVVILTLYYLYFSAKNDVTKQKDLSGFYRYILNETTNDVDQKEDVKKYVKQ